MQLWKSVDTALWKMDQFPSVFNRPTSDFCMNFYLIQYLQLVYLHFENARISYNSYWRCYIWRWAAFSALEIPAIVFQEVNEKIEHVTAISQKIMIIIRVHLKKIKWMRSKEIFPIVHAESFQILSLVKSVIAKLRFTVSRLFSLLDLTITELLAFGSGKSAHSIMKVFLCLI